MLDSQQSNSQSFNDSELSKGYHILTESSHTVKVNTPSVPPNRAHLYPRLAGSNWTSYLTQPRIILGRSTMATTTRTTRQMPPTPQVDLDFGSSKAISRKHCEIRFSTSRDRWELYVHSRNGVKLNHVIKKPRDKPNVLKTGALIEICNTSFIFFLPNNYIKPTEKGFLNTDIQEADTQGVHIQEADDNSFDTELELALIQTFENHSCLDTTEIIEKIKNNYIKPVEKENILHLLVLSPRFQLSTDSILLSAKDSDSVKWELIPLTTDTTEDGKLIKYEKNDISIKTTTIDTPSTINTQSTVNTPTTNINTSLIEIDKIQLLNSTDDMSIVSTNGNSSNRFSARSGSNRDEMSISANGLFPYIGSSNEINTFPGTTGSFSGIFDGEEGWSLFLPELSSQETNKKQPENKPLKPSETPFMFRAMSIESIYSIWSHGNLLTGSTADEIRPNKRLKSVELDADTPPTQDSEINIYQEVRRNIIKGLQ